MAVLVRHTHCPRKAPRDVLWILLALGHALLVDPKGLCVLLSQGLLMQLPAHMRQASGDKSFPLLPISPPQAMGLLVHPSTELPELHCLLPEP